VRSHVSAPGPYMVAAMAGVWAPPSALSIGTPTAALHDRTPVPTAELPHERPPGRTIDRFKAARAPLPRLGRLTPPYTFAVAQSDPDGRDAPQASE
jgi:hypothetical protein